MKIKDYDGEMPSPTSRKLTAGEKQYIREAIDNKGWDGAFEEGWAYAEDSGDPQFLQLVLQLLRAKAALGRYIGEDPNYPRNLLRDYEQAVQKAQRSAGDMRRSRRSRPSSRRR
jgi:hypothetical protein